MFRNILRFCDLKEMCEQNEIDKKSCLKSLVCVTSERYLFSRTVKERFDKKRGNCCSEGRRDPAQIFLHLI